MKSQLRISRISTKSDTGYVYFRASCGCGGDGHDHELFLEKDNYGFITLNVTMYPNLSWWQRIKLLFKPQLVVDFLFKSEEQIADYIDALSEGVDYIKKFEQE